MDYKLEIINPLDYPNWDELLRKAKGASFFHTSSWAKVLYETYNYTPIYFALFDSTQLAGLLPVMEVKGIFRDVKGVSLPFSDYCPAILTNGLAINSIMEAARDFGRKCNWKSLETRDVNYADLPPAVVYYKHGLDLTAGCEALYANLKKNVQRNIRKAAREGVIIDLSTSLESVRDYYRLHCITRKNQGVPPQPFVFFKKIYEHIINTQQGSVITASYENRNIAAAMFFHFNEQVLFKFGASDHKYQHLRANDFVMWEGIKYYAQKGYKKMCFGRTAVDNEGLRHFKAGLGANEEIIKYYKYDFRRNAFVSEKQVLTKMHNRLFRVMPVFMLRIFGSVLYKYMG